MAEISPSEWDRFLAQHHDAHILQTSCWGQLKSEFGWQVFHLTAGESGAQVMVKQVLPGVRFAYIPKGPVGEDWNALLPELDGMCKRRNCAFLKIEPDQWVGEDESSQASPIRIPDGFIQSHHSIQPLRTLVVDISGEENHILARMKQKTRYNINLALKKNVVIRPHTELGAFYQLMETTGQRDQFGIHNLAYYQRAFDLFHDRDRCRLLVAEYERNPLAALIVFRYGVRAWYFYGASSNTERDRMPNYLLQWEAMRWAKSQGCTKYDLWGVPDVDLDTLEANFSRKEASLWGVYRFKRGFGGELKRSMGPWDRVYKPALYRLYRLWLKIHPPDA